MAWVKIVNSAWIAKQREIDTLRAENERLARAFADSEAACLIQVQMVRAENERLRQLVKDLQRLSIDQHLDIERLQAIERAVRDFMANGGWNVGYRISELQRVLDRYPPP